MNGSTLLRSSEPVHMQPKHNESVRLFVEEHVRWDMTGLVSDLIGECEHWTNAVRQGQKEMPFSYKIISEYNPANILGLPSWRLHPDEWDLLPFAARIEDQLSKAGPISYKGAKWSAQFYGFLVQGQGPGGAEILYRWSPSYMLRTMRPEGDFMPFADGQLHVKSWYLVSPRFYGTLFELGEIVLKAGPCFFWGAQTPWRLREEDPLVRLAAVTQMR